MLDALAVEIGELALVSRVDAGRQPESERRSASTSCSSFRIAQPRSDSKDSNKSFAVSECRSVCSSTRQSSYSHKAVQQTAPTFPLRRIASKQFCCAASD